MLNQTKTHIALLALLLLLVYSKLPAFQNQLPLHHRVLKGETLYGLSQQYDKPVTELKRINSLTDDQISANQLLIIGFQKRQDSTQHLIKELASELTQLSHKALKNNHSRRAGNTIDLDLESLFSTNLISNPTYQLQNKVFEEKADQLKRDLGLKTTVSYTHNFEPGILDAEGLFFINRVSAGVSWELLNNGFLGNRQKAALFEKRQTVNNLMAQKATRKQQYTYYYNYLIYIFNKERINLLEGRISMLEKFLTLASQIYYIRAISWDEVISMKSQLAEYNEALNYTKAYNDVFEQSYVDLNFENLQAGSLPVLQLDLQKILNTNTLDSINSQILTHERERVALAYSKYRDVSLNAQLRYNALTGSTGQGARTFASLGLSLSAPLFKNKRNEQIQKAEIGLIEQQQNQEKVTTSNEVINLYYEYEYGLKQYINLDGKIAVAEERLKRQADSHLILNEADAPISTLRRVGESLDLAYELIDLKQKLYLNLLKIFTLSGAESIAAFAEAKDYELSANKIRDERGVYLWSNTLASIQSSFLLSYLNKNEISKVMLSTNGDSRREKAFLTQAALQQVSVFKLIGENSYIHKGFTPALQQKVKNLDLLYDGIHLDIEPQALEGWAENKERYLANLVSIVNQVRGALSADKHLSISIPVFFPQEIISEIAVLTDQVVIMAYGNTNAEVIISRLKEELGISPAQLAIALRADDFSSRITLERLIKQLMNETTVSHFMMHDLGSLIQLDQKTILGDIKPQR